MSVDWTRHVSRTRWRRRLDFCCVSNIAASSQLLADQPCASSGAERGRAEPARLRHVQHDAVGSRPLHLDVAFGVRADAERLLDVVAAARPGSREPLRDHLEALDLKADVMD